MLADVSVSAPQLGTLLLGELDVLLLLLRTIQTKQASGNSLSVNDWRCRKHREEGG
jgi:hypothetical protein